MKIETRGIFRLKCSVQNYDWGKIGKESGVARLYEKNSGKNTQDDKPYAEFWIGTHDSGPSYTVAIGGPKENGENGHKENGFFRNGCGGLKKENGDNHCNHYNVVSLKEWIGQNPSVLGDKVFQRWGPNLPFLFKVLSVAKALSLQAHPDKDLAAILHEQWPDVYKDDNHKPEMALALTEFGALCGFVSHEELIDVVQDVPEIMEVVGDAHVAQLLDIDDKDYEEEEVREVLRSIFMELMSVSKLKISEVTSKLITRLNAKCEVGGLTDKEKLILQLEKQYPSDVGLIAAFLFNYVKLNPGDALYVAANEPHAYVYGECIECMATSDNVVRAGLTPKYRDVKTLCSMLTYKQGLPEMVPKVALNPYTVKYLPPFDEFEVDRCILPQGTSAFFPAVPGPSIFLVLSGQGTMSTLSSKELVQEGDVLFTPANTEITVATTSWGLSLYRAGVNSKFFEQYGNGNLKSSVGK